MKLKVKFSINFSINFFYKFFLPLKYKIVMPRGYEDRVEKAEREKAAREKAEEKRPALDAELQREAAATESLLATPKGARSLGMKKLAQELEATEVAAERERQRLERQEKEKEKKFFDLETEMNKRLEKGREGSGQPSLAAQWRNRFDASLTSTSPRGTFRELLSTPNYLRSEIQAIPVKDISEMTLDEMREEILLRKRVAARYYDEGRGRHPEGHPGHPLPLALSEKENHLLREEVFEYGSAIPLLLRNQLSEIRLEEAHKVLAAAGAPPAPWRRQQPEQPEAAAAEGEGQSPPPPVPQKTQVVDAGAMGDAAGKPGPSQRRRKSTKRKRRKTKKRRRSNKKYK
jgi:hypothetical protein